MVKLKVDSLRRRTSKALSVRTDLLKVSYRRALQPGKSSYCSLPGSGLAAAQHDSSATKFPQVARVGNPIRSFRSPKRFRRWLALRASGGYCRPSGTESETRQKYVAPTRSNRTCSKEGQLVVRKATCRRSRRREAETAVRESRAC